MSGSDSEVEEVPRVTRSRINKQNIHSIRARNARLKKQAQATVDNDDNNSSNRFGRVPLEELQRKNREWRNDPRRTVQVENNARGFRGEEPGAPMETDSARTGGTAANHLGTGVGKATLVRGPMDHTLTADGFKFSKLYHLVLRTVSPMVKFKSSIPTSGAMFLSFVYGLFCFDPSEIKQYINSMETAWLGNMDCNMKVSRISGVAKVLGPGAPFIANATATAATNSQITLSRMTATGLERVTPIVKAKITMPDIGTVPTAVKETYTDTAGSKDAGWWTFQKAKVASAPAANAFVAMTSPNSDMGYVTYNQIGALEGSAAFNATSFDPPNIGKLMQESDVADTPGSLFSFEHHPEFFLKLQGLGLNAAPHTQKLVNADYSTSHTLPATAGAVTTSLAGGYSGFEDYLPLANGTDDVWINTSNTYMVGGKEHTVNHALPYEYVFLVPPPTTDESLIQECNLYITYQTEMEIAVRFDTLAAANTTTSALGNARIWRNMNQGGNQYFATPLDAVLM